MGPQYRRSYSRSMPSGSAPYDMSPSLRIAVALTEPHSLGSMGGMHTPSPGAEFWGMSLEPNSARGRSSAAPAGRSAALLSWGGRRGGGSVAGVAAPARGAAANGSLPASAPTPAPAPAGSFPQQNAARVPSIERSGSFYKYSAFYSGMDVGVTPPISTGGGGALGGSGQGMPVTPRPNELLASAMQQQEWCVA